MKPKALGKDGAACAEGGPAEKTPGSEQTVVEDGTVPPAVDSAALVTDLGRLAMAQGRVSLAAGSSRPDGERGAAMRARLLKQAEEAPRGAASYPLALQALWNGCPDALDIALQRLEPVELADEQRRDAELMADALDFMRIGQLFLSNCHQFHKTADSAFLQAGLEVCEKRCAALIAHQPERLESRLPGLVGRRDTAMLSAKMRATVAKLIEGAVY